MKLTSLSDFVKFVLEPLGQHPKFQLEVITIRLEYISDVMGRSNQIEEKNECLDQLIKLHHLFAHVYEGNAISKFMSFNPS